MLANELRLLLQCILRSFKAANDHGVDNAIHLEIGELSAKGLIFHLGEPTDHVFTWIGFSLLDLIVDIGFEGL